MAKCVVCGKDSGKGVTCGPTCRQRLRRKLNKGVTISESGCDIVTVESNCDTVEDVTVDKPIPAYDMTMLGGVKVNGRQAVRYDFEEAWDLRPEPLSLDDRPKLLNRGKYIRPDGSEYQFDVTGQVFECNPDSTIKAPDTAVSGQTAGQTVDNAK